MNHKEPKAMQEIHEIRIKLHERKKNKSFSEKSLETKNATDKFIKSHGLEKLLFTNLLAIK